MAGHEGPRCVAAALRGNRQGRRPNQRLQRAGARGSKVDWLVSAPEVMQVLCGWRAVACR